MLSDKELLTEHIEQSALRLCAKVEAGNLAFKLFIIEFNQWMEKIDNPKIHWQLQPYIFIHQLPKQFSYLLAAKDVEHCLKDLIKHKEAFMTAGTQLKAYKKSESIICTIDCGTTQLTELNYIYDILLLFFHVLCKSFVGQKFDYQQIVYPDFRKGQDIALSEVSNAKLVFRGNQYYVIFGSEWFSKQSYFYNPDLQNALKVEVKRELTQHSLQTTGITALQVSNIINNAEKPAKVTADVVSRILNTSESQLRRKLKEENTSFKLLQRDILFKDVITRLISTNTKIDAIALELGFSERTSFERSFKSEFGVTAAKFREFGQKLAFKEPEDFFNRVVNELPPLSKSCQQLVNLTEDQLNLPNVIAILDKDPIFSARIMGLASKAVYGNAPADMAEAIGRRIGIETVKNLAIVYLAKDQLSTYVKHIEVKDLFKAIVISPQVYKKVAAASPTSVRANQPIDNQILMFGLLGFFLIFHKDDLLEAEIRHELTESNNFSCFTKTIREKFNIDFYAVASILLAAWGLPNNLVKELSSLNDSNQQQIDVINRYHLIELTHTICLHVSFKHWHEKAEIVFEQAGFEKHKIEKIVEFAEAQTESVGNI